MTHILLSIFKKPLHWVEQKYKRQGIFDAINKITIINGPIHEPLAWIFVIKEGFSYYDMPFDVSEFVAFTDWNEDYVKYRYTGIYAVLTKKNEQQLKNLHQARQIESIRKFIKSNVFYPYYLEESHVQGFISLIRIKKLRFNSCLNWKDEDGSHKIGVLYRGLLSIECPWKRNIEVAQLTRGTYITNRYIKDHIEEIQDFQLEEVDPKPKQPDNFPHYRYVSKSDETVLLIFNVRLINEEPYNVNPDILPLVKQSYEKYASGLDKIMAFDDINHRHRNKSSIKDEIKRKEMRTTIRRETSTQMYKNSTSPIVRTFATMDMETSPFETVKTIELPEPVKPFSKTVFTSISPRANKYHRSYSTEQPRSFSSRRVVHNTFVEESSKKKPNSKSFSTLRTISTHHPQRKKREAEMSEQMSATKKAEFFVPDQFVKKKLRMKYEELVRKVRNMDLSVKRSEGDNINEKMEKLEEYIQSKRIVKISNAKRMFKIIRDKKQY